MPFPIQEPRVWAEHLTWEEAVDAGDRFMQKVGAAPGETRLRLSVHASGGLNTVSLNAQLVQWQIQGWIPDVVIVDYADLLGRIPGIESKWESVEETWRQLRAISQQWHICLITATQASRTGYGKELLDMDDFNGSRTQNDNVTALYSINQTEAESLLGVQRIQAIANRDNPDRRVVATLGSRSVACPVMYSKFCVGTIGEDEKPKSRKHSSAGKA